MKYERWKKEIVSTADCTGVNLTRGRSDDGKKRRINSITSVIFKRSLKIFKREKERERARETWGGEEGKEINQKVKNFRIFRSENSLPLLRLMNANRHKGKMWVGGGGKGGGNGKTASRRNESDQKFNSINSGC